MRNLAALVLVGLALSGCSSRPANCPSSLTHIQADETTLDFKGVFVRQHVQKAITLTLEGCSPTPLILNAVPDFFTVDLGAATLSPREQRTVTVTFAPTDYGEFSGDAIIGAPDTPQKTVVIDLHGVANPVEFRTDPFELDFGVVRVGSSKTLPLAIPSVMDSPQHVEITSDDPAFTIEPDNVNLPGNGYATVQVTFRPTTRGAFDGPHLHFALCPACEEVRITVKGVGAIEDFSLTPDPLDFGTHSPGSTTCQDVTIRNTGDVPIMFAAVTPDAYFTQSGIFDLQIGNLLDGSTHLDVKATTTVTICFTPKAIAKDYNGRVGFNTLDNLYKSLPVHGRGGTAQFACVPDHVDFGVSIPSAPVIKPLVCKNLGEPEDVLLRSLTVDQPENVRFDFAQDGGAAGFNVGRADFHFTATFTASVPGVYAPTINVTFGRPGVIQDELLQIPVSGTLIDGAPCSLSVRPAEVNFGLVGFGGSYSRSLQIVNTSPNSDCILWGFGLDGSQSQLYRVDGMPSAITNVPPHTILDLTVAYQPTIPSSSPDTQTLTFNQVAGLGQDPSVRVPIRGFGTPSLGVAVSPDPIDFDSIPVNYVKHMAVNVINMAAENLEVSDIALSSDSSAAFGLSNLPLQPPEFVPVGRALTFEATFAPTSVGDATGTLVVRLKDAAAPILMPMRGTGNNAPCDGLCNTPQASCPAAQTTLVGTVVPLTGDGFDQNDPTGTNVTCHWDVVQAPNLSTASPSPLDACITKFRPDVGGLYKFQLRVENGQGTFDTCTTQVNAKTH